MIEKSDARRIAADWHNGQGSALYAFSSSGSPVDGLEGECERVMRECERRVATGAELTFGVGVSSAELLEEARELLAFVRRNVSEQRAAAAGLVVATIEGRDFDDLADDALEELREGIRSELLESFEWLDGPELADVMDDELSSAGFPLERV